MIDNLYKHNIQWTTSANHNGWFGWSFDSSSFIFKSHKEIDDFFTFSFLYQFSKYLIW